jgi:hypothetical protein
LATLAREPPTDGRATATDRAWASALSRKIFREFSVAPLSKEADFAHFNRPDQFRQRFSARIDLLRNVESEPGTFTVELFQISHAGFQVKNIAFKNPAFELLDTKSPFLSVAFGARRYQVRQLVGMVVLVFDVPLGRQHGSAIPTMAIRLRQDLLFEFIRELHGPYPLENSDATILLRTRDERKEKPFPIQRPSDAAQSRHFKDAKAHM